MVLTFQPKKQEKGGEEQESSWDMGSIGLTCLYASLKQGNKSSTPITQEQKSHALKCDSDSLCTMLLNIN